MVLWPKWTYDNQAKPQDPLNIIFQNLKLSDITTFLISQQGWNQNVWPAFDQYLPHPDLHTLKKQDLQLQFGNIAKRVHGRFWEIDSEVLVNVHHEVASIPQHLVLDYHAAEMYLAEVCKKNPHWKVAEDLLDLQNFFGGHAMPYNDGKATVISR